MCGIAGAISLKTKPIDRLQARLKVMHELLAHRGPDDLGVWSSERDDVGFAHRRLTIIDLTKSASQPMSGPNGSVIVFNGEVYNYKELQSEYRDGWQFRTASDTESILAAYDRHGSDCVSKLRGMFAFAIWDERRRQFFAARDRLGIKPFYYMVIDDVLYFASEAKALMPFVLDIETDSDALAEYITFQYTIGEQTLFKGIKQLLPGHAMTVKNGTVSIQRYWDIDYEIDWEHSPRYFYSQLREHVDSSINLHLRSDVPIGAYMSGGIDSTLMSILSSRKSSVKSDYFHGKFTEFPGYDESYFAELGAEEAKGTLHQIDITAQDFIDNISDTIYHLDYPVAGPGSFPQYMVSQLAAKHVKVVLGGQGGDEIFGGYARYLVAYLEQCIKAALDGTYQNGNYVVTIESIVPNLGLLREYKPMIRQFWSDGVFDEVDARYFRLVNRAGDLKDEIDWSDLDMAKVYDSFRAIFNNENNVRKNAYFDKMTHFDFKCLLPALLHVEDRMSMAHGLESRVPLLDHELIEFSATVPADVKFKDGRLKHLIKEAFHDVLPRELVDRRDKMGFPVPLKEWYSGALREFINDTFSSKSAQSRPFLNSDKIKSNFTEDAQFSRKTWGLLSLELWQQTFHDRAHEFRSKLQ